MSTLRISGLASGMDIDQMVKDLMKAEKMPLDKMNQKKTYLEWQRDDYRDVNKSLFDFSNNIFDGVMKQNTFIQKTINTSNENVAFIRNLSSTGDFSGTLDVGSIASAATMHSSSSILDASSAPIDPTKKLSDYGFTATQTIKIDSIGSDGKLDTSSQALTFDPTQETLNSLISKINKQFGVSMFYDSGTNTVAMTAKNTGNAKDASGNDVAEIQLTDSADSFLTNFLHLNLTNDAANGTTDANGQASGTKGVDASFTFNGLKTTRSSNTFSINGVEFTLKEAGTTNFSSSPDVDNILDSITKFVDEYNKLIENVNGKIDERKNRDYPPLTTEQRDAMSDKEAELWDEKAKQGTLYNDSVLSSGLNQMRNDFYSPVNGTSSTFSQLAQIGITTSSNFLDKGKLVIDPDKLKEAISKDPNGIYELFAKDGATTSDKGIARRLRDTIQKTMDGIEQKAGKTSSVNNTFTIGRDLNSLTDQIDSFNDRMKDVEDRYYRQFTAMEQAIQKSNQQATYLMNQFGGGGQ
ncbi:flagellar hook-associated protein 2 [Falsibacillus albus]|uniref:Flagellar hook-associated protein 2 n=1 Tax=Falsibacillus albus TaxID=2478915 RepID=A0A3L7K3A0_9BACI|nr:flagellar hook-associated protein 2 [Falsibacillus albus]RLQ96784.1 flagellar hook-associated protein 2 [Falsibacillus albus]